MSSLTKEDVYLAVKRLPSAIRELLKSEGPKLFVAGGYLRSIVASEEISDLDLFCQSQASAELLARRLAGNNKRKLITTDNAYTVPDPYITSQFIHRWTFTDPARCIDTFDFTVACAALWHDAGAWASICDPRFYPDLAAKRLVYRSPIRNEDAGGSLLRVLKFYQRGYRIPLDSMGAVVARMMQGVEESRLASRDEKGLATVLTGLLREVDPLIDPEHIYHAEMEAVTS